MALSGPIIDQLARVLAQTPWQLTAITTAVDDMLKPLARGVGAGPRVASRRRRKISTKMAEALLTHFFTGIAPPETRIAQALVVICETLDADDVWDRLEFPETMTWLLPSYEPIATFAALDLPRLETPRDLAIFLDLPLDQLDWYAGLPPFRPLGSIGTLLHYRFAFHRKSNGQLRLIEAPKPRLKAMQTRILREILDSVPMHPAVHGFVRKRSPVTAAAVHASEALVIAADIEDFFPSIPAGRVYGLFRCLGYAPAVARHLTGLVTTVTLAEVFRDLALNERPAFAVRQAFTTPHLPQGAPTSPTLANLVAYRLDVRLAGLARRFGFAYTRYADDLAFSGDTLGVGQRAAFVSALNAIAVDEGFALHPDKTRFMPTAGAQRLLGLSINAHINLPRQVFDRLKAILTNCARHGPASQNREGHAHFQAHLDGRVQWVEHINRARGAKLRAIFQRIVWER